MGEEVPRLQHRVRVLERALETETTLSKEYYSDLCTKTIDNTTLGKRRLKQLNLLDVHGCVCVCACLWFISSHVRYCTCTYMYSTVELCRQLSVGC